MTTAHQTLTIGDRTYPGPMDRNTAVFARISTTLLRWNERARQRRHLSGLTLRELADVGITPEAASVEAAKPFWKA